MVSLDGYQAHINIATYDRHYLDYLSGGAPAISNYGFMEMDETFHDLEFLFNIQQRVPGSL